MTIDRKAFLPLLFFLLPACLAYIDPYVEATGDHPFLTPVNGDDTLARPSSSTITVSSPSGTYFGRSGIPLTFHNTTGFSSAWYNINGAVNVSIHGNTTVDLGNQTLGVQGDGHHVLHLYVDLVNGTLVHEASAFTVYSLQLFQVAFSNRVHGLVAQFTRHGIAGMDALGMILDEYEPLINVPTNATNVTFNVNYVSPSHRIQLTGYNTSENYTFWSNPVSFGNTGFKNATGARVDITVTPNMPARLVAGAVASFDVTIKNTGTITLHRVTMHVGARNPETGKTANQTLGGADLPPNGEMQIAFNFILSRDYDQITVLFNVTADEYCIENVVAHYRPGSGIVEAFLAFLFPWGALLVGAILVSMVVASHYRKRLRSTRRADAIAKRERSAEQSRRFVQQRRETDKFLERQKPRLDFQAGTDAYDQDIPWIGENQAKKAKKHGKQGEILGAGKVGGIDSGSQELHPAARNTTVPDDSDISVDLQRDKCVVHAGPIKGISYICPSCGTKYCMACATALKDKNEGCWQCKQPIDM